MRHLLLPLLLLLPAVHCGAQSALQSALHHLEAGAELSATVADHHAPLWLSANRYGLVSTEDASGYLRLTAAHSASADTARRWRIGWGGDVAVATGFTNAFTVQQLYADFDLRLTRRTTHHASCIMHHASCTPVLRLSVGAKERPMQMKNQELSSGSQTFGINARPVPDIRLELPEYLPLDHTHLVSVKGHVGYGMMTDGRWLRSYTGGDHDQRRVLLHTKAGYLRLGNPQRFPLVLEGGLEMACQFGGSGQNVSPAGFKDFFKALLGQGADKSDGIYANAEGNTVGSWILSASWQAPTWKLRAYYDHYFEDHSQMFLQYGWRDGLLGLELTLPRNPAVTTLVYEHLRTDYQSGPVYHDHTPGVPDQVSGADNYYNHLNYPGWQHWGQAMGNPLFLSPLYWDDGRIDFRSNRMRTHHFALAGDPTPRLHYRLLCSFTRSWGTYAHPYHDARYGRNFLLEARYLFPHRLYATAAFGLDRGNLLGSATGASLTLGWKL